VKRNEWGGLMVPEPGGYVREHASTFGAGTLRDCHHQWWIKRRVFWMRHGRRYKFFAWERPGDAVGDKRCNKCGAKEEPR